MPGHSFDSRLSPLTRDESPSPEWVEEELVLFIVSALFPDDAKPRRCPARTECVLGGESTIGTFGKLFTEIIENTENPPGEAIFSVGASRLQVIRFSVIPQILPSLIANLLYAFDVNMRTAISLGIFGGGGIGFEFQMAKSVLHFKDVTALISLIIVLVFFVEKLSDYLRKKILGEGKLK